MLIGVPREIANGERRVALVPDVVQSLTRAGHQVVIERAAGLRAGFTDEAYRDVGCDLADTSEEVYRTAALVMKVQRPTTDGGAGRSEVDMMTPGSALIGLLQPSGDPELFAKLAERDIVAFSMELVPRTTRAQMMDALSSQSTVAAP